MCDDRERLIGYVYDECDAAERREIARHLDECGTCRAEIAGLRGARQDLLAWEVQGEPAVWRPLVVPQPTVWWRQVPSWAMAAAALVMFAAGGLVTHALVSPAAPVVAIGPAPDAGRIDLTDVEQRVLARLRAEMAIRESPATEPRAVRTANGIDPAQMMERIGQMVGESEQRQLEMILGLNNGLSIVSEDNKLIRRELERMTQMMQSAGGGPR